ncbi:MAG: ComEA family DNA-binding protein [Actinomycetes bacterium]|jgi:competence protein ComEA|nr:ComEA family DNA-binding protein [Actinomycetes bacterium]
MENRDEYSPLDTDFGEGFCEDLDAISNGDVRSDTPLFDAAADWFADARDDAARKIGLRSLPTSARWLLAGLLIAAACWGLWRWKTGGSGGVQTAPQAAIEIVDAADAAADPVDASGSDASAADADAVGGLTSSDSSVTVHIAGAVHHAGVYTLPAGSRVVDAVNAAGGMTAKAATTAVNLAEALVDGGQWIIPTKAQIRSDGAAGSTSTGSGSTTPSTGDTHGTAGSVNINTADATTLQTLDGVGPVLAQRIVDDREQNGRFGSVDDLSRVSGIGDKKLAAIRGSVTVK